MSLENWVRRRYEARNAATSANDEALMLLINMRHKPLPHFSHLSPVTALAYGGVVYHVWHPDPSLKDKTLCGYQASAVTQWKRLATGSTAPHEVIAPKEDILKSMFAYARGLYDVATCPRCLSEAETMLALMSRNFHKPNVLHRLHPVVDTAWCTADTISFSLTGGQKPREAQRCLPCEELHSRIYGAKRVDKRMADQYAVASKV